MGAVDCSESPIHLAFTGQHTILVVEDDPDVRTLVRDMLDGQGYAVLAADDAGAALDISRRHAGPIHVLLSDVVMPKMSGLDLARTLMCARHELRVVYMSGYPREATSVRELEPMGAIFLGKPFSITTLSRTLRSLLRTEPIDV